ncbi:MAG: SRPBCC family protein [Nitrospirae bacterium]|nr:SRPBCC family protein [Nitrospirota bacterium]
MHKIVESIEIKAPVERVFAFLKDIEARLRLNPFWQVLRVERITVGEIGAGSKFHIIIKSADRKVDYTSGPLS